MRSVAVLFLFLISGFATAQESTVSATLLNDNTLVPISSASIINVNQARGASTDDKGFFEIAASVNDTLHISLIGFQSIKVRVTNDWFKTKNTKIQLTEKAIALEEILVQPYKLTGYLEVDSRLIPTKENFRYSISGLSQGYEAGEYSPGAFGKVLGSLFNPADMLYNFFGKKPRELKRLREMKKDPHVRTMMESKYDRETIAVLLGVDKKEIAEILERCNYSNVFIESANDLQIMDAISGCYEQYKVLKRN